MEGPAPTSKPVRSDSAQAIKPSVTAVPEPAIIAATASRTLEYGRM